jgi:transposase
VKNCRSCLGLTVDVTIHVQHMQKALDQMNLQLHHVISDITGVSGMAIIVAILNGERDPMLLSQMCDKRVKASRQTIAAALVGDYRREHLFTLRQSLHAYRQCQDLIAACDREIEQQLAAFDSKVDPRATPLPKPKDRHKPRRNQMKFDLRSEMYRIYGVDLTAVPGIDALTAHVLFAEIGPDLSRFSTVAGFVSWLGLRPDNRISGGKLLSVRTRLVKSRVAKALRMAAQSLHRSQSYLGSYYRRMRTRLGTPKAITAAAHKLARVIYHLLATRQPYEESVFVRCEALHQQRLENRIRCQARERGFTLVNRQRYVFLGTASKWAALEYRNHCLSPAVSFAHYLRRAFRHGELSFHGQLQPLAQKHNFIVWLNRIARSEWVVYAKPPFGGPQQVLKYLAR